jgi:hypothetical protein
MTSAFLTLCTLYMNLLPVNVAGLQRMIGENYPVLVIRTQYTSRSEAFVQYHKKYKNVWNLGQDNQLCERFYDQTRNKCFHLT